MEPECQYQENWNLECRQQQTLEPGTQNIGVRNAGTRDVRVRNTGTRDVRVRNTGTRDVRVRNTGTSRYPESRNPRPSQWAARATGRYLEPVEANAIQEKPGCPKPELVRITCVNKLTRNEQSQGPVTRNLEKLRKFVGEALYVGETRIS